MIGSFLFAVSLVLQGASNPAERRIQNTPENHWLFQSLARIKKEGLIAGYPDGMLYHVPPGIGRDQLVVMLRTADANLLKLADGVRETGLDAERNAHPTEIDRSNYAAMVKDLGGPDYERDLTELERICRWAAAECAPEMKELGIRPSSLTEPISRFRSTVRAFAKPQFGDAYRQFSDVPPDHWAAKAVLDLRRWGIIDGYPDGKFGGQTP